MSPETRNQLLTSQERAACQQIAAGAAPHSQRATALLVLNEGVTQAEAGQYAGLSRGQVQYWLNKFRQQRLDIFPADLWDEMVQPLSVKEVEEGPQQEPAGGQPPGDAPKAKKAKDGKKKRGKKAKSKPKKAEKKSESVKGAVKTKRAKKAKKAKGGNKKPIKKAKKESKKAKGGKV
jgi:hypothetical protein